ncbi:MAG: valine--tRNA ligase [Candidatus Taylorbacteria bacterium]|nr:valine--tRNA ligase [Candidatus Taylorbacteria bacterium]
MINDKFLKPYNPQETEERIYKLWEESGFFNPDTLPGKCEKTFTIVMPPPNVTGVLHMGHALMLTLEDIMIRYKRMCGFKTLWLPGTDHAAIATQARVEKDIYKTEKKSRHDLGREEFLKRVEAFAKQSHDTITSQIRVMGASCDWSREAYTLDEKRSLAVRTMFKMMYDDGLIYRGSRIVNWDPKGQTTISDDEIVYEERKAKLYTFRYSKDFPIPIATTRPETKLGDVGVAVHPDGKWKQYIGQTFEIPDFAGVSLSIKVVGDTEVDPEFGTGAIGITPTHSFIDWEIAGRHALNKDRIVINEYAKMTEKAGPHAGKKTSEARESIVEWLKSEGLLEKEEEITQNVSTAERTGGIVEPLPKLQWFIDVNKPIKTREGKTLKDLMREAVKSGDIKILPNHFEKIYFHWIENLRDWCISRQIWFGHRVPVWYRSKLKVEDKKDEEVYVGVEPPRGDGWEQDPDTLDTWFSSGLWTFSTLGWPEKTKDIELYHPTDVLETGYEILFFWIARMVLMTKYALGTVPFRTVYLHGTVRDGQGRKMSKSLGNGIDPIDVAKKFGTDAGRMALIVGNTPGTDMNISEDKIRGYKNFANKLWNIVRFVIENTQGEIFEDGFTGYTETDAKLREERHEMFVDVTKDMEEYRFYMAAEKLYHYAWHTFADKILEESKVIFEKGTDVEKKSRKQLLIHSLDKILKTLHPFIPFVTEEIWQLWKQPKGKDGMLMVAEWPIK